MEDAGQDPIRRAELIGNIVQSISVIPEAIVRDVYIKECAQLLHVEDRLLVSEVAKRREKEAERKAEQRERERRRNTATAQPADDTQTPADNIPAPTADDLPPEAYAPPFPDDPSIPVPVTAEAADSYTSFIPQEGKEGQEFYRYERLILQMVVRYGERVMCNVTDEEGKETPVTVIEFVVADLQQDDLAFHNPLHRQMMTEAAAHLHDEGFRAEHYFLTHPDPVISRLSTELISDRYQLSKYHYKNQKIVTDEERLYELVPLLTTNFKYAIVGEELKHMMRALQDPKVVQDEAQCNAIMQRYSELREVQSVMAKRLGDRVVLSF